MKRLNHYLLLASLAFLLSFPTLIAQEISIHVHRRVSPEDMEEYLKRETTYWQKFAESEIEKGNLTFWAVFQKIGGTDLPHSPNILIINGYSDIDKGVDWASVTDLFPGVEMEDIATNGLFTGIDQIFIRDLNNHIQVENPEFNFVHIIYHNPVYTGAYLDFEANVWKPMLQKAMTDGKTTVQGWGNGEIVSPESEDFPFSTYSYDLFSSAGAALGPYFSDDVEFPEDFGANIADNSAGPRRAGLYRIVTAATMQEE